MSERPGLIRGHATDCKCRECEEVRRSILDGEPAAAPPCGCTRDLVCTEHTVTAERVEQTREKLSEAAASARASMAAAPAPAAPLDVDDLIAKHFPHFGKQWGCLGGEAMIDAARLRLTLFANEAVARLSAELEQVRKALKIPADVPRYDKPPDICPECDGTRFISAGPKHFVCIHCSLVAELEQVKAERDLANRHAADLFKRLQAAEAALGEKGESCR